MGVQDRVHVGARGVDLRMQVKLERRPRGALHERAIEIDRDDVRGGQRETRRRARVDVEGRGVAPRAAVAAVVDDLGARQHPNRIDQLLRYFQGNTDT